jgi:hypothetical protein
VSQFETLGQLLADSARLNQWLKEGAKSH